MRPLTFTVAGALVIFGPLSTLYSEPRYVPLGTAAKATVVSEALSATLSTPIVRFIGVLSCCGVGVFTRAP